MITNTKGSIISTGSQTLLQLCKSHGLNIEEVYLSNDYNYLKESYSISESVLTVLEPYNYSVKSYLKDTVKFNIPVVSGLEIFIPYKTNGDLIKDLNLGNNLSLYDYSYEKSGPNNLYTNKSFASKLSVKGLSTGSYVPPKYFTSIFYRVDRRGSGQLDPVQLPVIPQEFSESNQAKFNPVSMMGRSVDYQIYEGSSRSVSFTLQLHEELFTPGKGYNNIHNIVGLIQSCCYPFYGNSNNDYARPPEVVFIIGKQFYIRGILTSCSATWVPPLVNDRYVNCNLSIGVQETKGPYSADEVAKMKGYHNK